MTDLRLPGSSRDAWGHVGTAEEATVRSATVVAQWGLFPWPDRQVPDGLDAETVADQVIRGHLEDGHPAPPLASREVTEVGIGAHVAAQASQEYVERTGATFTGASCTANAEEAGARITGLAITGGMPTVPSPRQAG